MLPKLTKTQIRFWDANGWSWIWDCDTKIVYLEKAQGDPENGYPAENLEEAITKLTEYGYME